jgi:hypothetical protein
LNIKIGNKTFGDAKRDIAIAVGILFKTSLFQGFSQPIPGNNLSQFCGIESSKFSTISTCVSAGVSLVIPVNDSIIS